MNPHPHSVQDASASAAPEGCHGCARRDWQGGVELLVDNGLLKQHQVNDRHAVGEACLAALEQWAGGHGARSMGQG